MQNKKILVVGGGPAGMMAAIAAVDGSSEVHLYEKNEKLGKKLFITGKGRCNVTNNSDNENIQANIVSNPKFMYSALATCSSGDVIEFFEKEGLSLKTERGERVFPVSDKSSDVIKTLEKALKNREVKVHLKKEVKKLMVEESKCIGIVLSSKEKVFADKVVVATGGISYPTTGSTGDGHKWAQEENLRVTALTAGLVPIETQEEWVKELQGLSLRNVKVQIYRQKKCLYKEFGEMLFTHFGVSGPLIISASSKIGKELLKEPLKMEIDLKPALSEETLDNRILREFETGKNKDFKNIVGSLLPAKMIPIILKKGPIAGDKKVHEITKEERLAFVYYLKHFTIHLLKLRKINEAIITKGGVSVKEINPKTMEAKKIANLYFAGEVLDVDALTGGYNLQIAWATGYLAGKSSKEKGE